MTTTRRRRRRRRSGRNDPRRPAAGVPQVGPQVATLRASFDRRRRRRRSRSISELPLGRMAAV